MGAPESFVDVLRETAQGARSGNGYTFLRDGEHDAQRLSYAQLERRALALAARLVERGAARERVMIILPAGLDYLVAFFGCLSAGAVAVPLAPPEATRPEPALAQARRVAAQSRPRLLLTSVELSDTLASIPAPLERLVVDGAAEAAELGFRPPPLGGDALAMLQYTSGSTAEPKGVALSHANLLANARAITKAFGVTPSSRGVCWLPPHHDMGLLGGILQPLVLGAETALMSPQAFLQRPLRFLEAITRFRATTCGGPTFAYDLLARRVPDSAKAALDLSCWEVAFCGAEPVRAETLDAFAAAFAGCGFRREAFLPCYGLAEATLLVTSSAPRRGPRALVLDPEALERGSAAPPSPGRQGRRFVSCGAPAEGVTLRVVDPETAAVCPGDRVGELWIRGPAVARGYWSDAEATRAAFDARSADGEGPYLRSGDLGVVRDGELFVTGRLKDLILIRGRNLYPQDLEATLERSHPAVRPGRTVAFGIRDGEERLVVACEVQRRSQEPPERLVETLRRAVAETHGVLPEDVVLLQPGALPRTSSGKPRRAICRALYLAGQLGAAS